MKDRGTAVSMEEERSQPMCSQRSSVVEHHGDPASIGVLERMPWENNVLTAIVADDEPGFRDLVRRLAASAGLSIIAEAETGESALELIQQWRPTIALRDILMPGLTGLDVLLHIRQGQLPTRVILFTGYARKDWVVRAVEGGVSALLFKDDRFDYFIRLAIEATVKGDVIMSPRCLRLLLEDYVRLLALERTGGLLTPREALIAKLIARGMSNKEMANELRLSVRTVENIRYTMMKKIDARGIADVVRYVDTHLNDQVMPRTFRAVAS